MTERSYRERALGLVFGHKIGHTLGHTVGPEHKMSAPHTKVVGEVYYYFRRVPRSVSHLDRRRFIKRSLRTRDPYVAKQKSQEIDRQLEMFWEELQGLNPDAAHDRHQAIVRICNAAGYSYRTAEELARDDAWREIVDRLEYLMSLTPPGEKPADEIAQALMGGSRPIEMKLSDVFRFYFDHSHDKTAGKSDRQAERWAQPRRLASQHLVETVGDVPINQLDRDRILLWRAALEARVTAGEIDAETANKHMSYVSAMLGDVGRKKQIEVPDFRGVKFKTKGAKTKRAPYSRQQIIDIFINGDDLMRMNEEARRIVFAMIETGMRPSEIANLRPDHIRLDANIPHVSVTEVEDRELKSENAPRDIPLVGVSLMAFKMQPNGFPKYRDNGDGLSAAANKFMMENGLRPSKAYTLYSLRHSFEDRMSEADNPDGRDDRFRAELMGHRYTARVKYGSGPSLERKLRLLEEIALPLRSAV